MSGHDTSVGAEGTGTLNYNLIVDNYDVEIGETIGVFIVPANELDIYARLQDCKVTYNSMSVPILNWNASGNKIKDPNYD